MHAVNQEVLVIARETCQQRGITMMDTKAHLVRRGNTVMTHTIDPALLQHMAKVDMTQLALQWIHRDQA